MYLTIKKYIYIPIIKPPCHFVFKILKRYIKKALKIMVMFIIKRAFKDEWVTQQYEAGLKNDDKYVVYSIYVLIIC